MFEEVLPPLPEFPDHESCFNVLLEWCKHVGILATHLNLINPGSHAAVKRPPIRYAVLRGLINRSCRILLAMLKIATENKQGEIVMLLSRCLFESCTKVRWLILRDNEEMFLRYLADGLKAEFELREIISRNVQDRDGKSLVIEDRMLRSIQSTISAAPYTEDELKNAKKLPDLASMCRELGYGDLGYVALQRLRSHAIHGTWPDLLFHYLEEKDGSFTLQDNTVPPDQNAFVVSSLLLLEALREYVGYLLDDTVPKEELFAHIEHVKQQILQTFYQASGSHYDPILEGST